jgi:two-component system phosphate regulon sensor histidine kinase PhoR
MRVAKTGTRKLYKGRHGLHLLVIIMSIALTGIVFVQWLWIDNAVQERQQKFDVQVQASLDRIILKIEKIQKVAFITKKLGKTTIKAGEAQDTTSINIFNYFTKKVDSAKNEKESEIKTSINIDRIVSAYEPIKKKQQPKPKPENIFSSIDSFMADSSRRITHMKINTSDLFSNILIEYETRNDPLNERINLQSLDIAIKQEVEERALGASYEYALWNSESDSILFRSDAFTPEFIERSYKTNLFPEDVVRKNDYLLLYLPNKNQIVLSSLALLLAGSIVFSLIIVVIFFITVNVAFKQKKISKIKTDFINNMTHEFKTPIATISLAADTIKNPKVISDNNQVAHFLGIIKEENNRMNKHVERILQMSLLEKKKLEFHLENANLYALTRKAIRNFELKIKKQQGRLDFIAENENGYAKVDEVHYLNILYNLLDNALKYSKTTPEVVVKIQTSNESIHIFIADNGIGIKKENQQKIFDKFFREASGDIHNVKGFGLGLSYVKAVVEAFNGTILLTSEQGKGSTFEIILPKSEK